MRGMTAFDVGSWPAEAVAPRLPCEWTEGHLLENGGHTGDLTVEQGADAAPEVVAELAAAWLEVQLLRPIERDEWWSR